MTRRSKTRRRAAPEVHDAFVTYIDGVLLSMMRGLVKSQDVEERYTALLERLRDASEQQMAAIARTAAAYYVSHANSSSLGSTREEVDRLKRAALEHAVKSTTL